MAVEAALPALGTVVVTALVDSVNPCAIGVLILLISTLVAFSYSKLKMFIIGIVYIFAVYLTYFLAGLGLTSFLYSIPLAVTQYITLIVAALVVIGGLIELKDFFWYGAGFSLAISPGMAKKVHEYARNISVPSVIFLGAFVAAVELPCTGGPYLAITLMLSQNFNLQAVYLLLLYNLIFILPLIIILFMVLAGTKIQHIKRWKQDSRKYMRLASGVVMIILGWLLMLMAQGAINLG